MDIQLNRLETINHPDIIPAFRIYAEAFPPDEQMSTAYWLQCLISLPDETKHLYSIITKDKEVVGLVYFEMFASDIKVATLWYFCTRADLRGQGLGASAYRVLRQTAWDAGARALVYEVEKPQVAANTSVERRDLAIRRINFYRRQGGRVLEGINYLQCTDNGSEPIPMHVMIDSPQPITPEAALQYANIGLEDSVSESGSLSLN